MMKESKKELEKAIIIVGESLGMEKATELLLKNVGLHSTIKELTYVMFVRNKQQYFEQDDAVFEAISLIRNYCEEMSKNGEVNFDVPYVYGV
jgi:5,10-methylene-tetrahydrofolate dehydrogenase/methenyl tetrahydrofolate cyclohydrolase